MEAPRPQPRPAVTGSHDPVLPDSPTPPDLGSRTGQASGRDTGASLPDVMPAPDPVPRTAFAPESGAETPSVVAMRPLPPAPPGASAPQPASACHRRLAELGVRFEAKPAIADAGGCGVSTPVEVSAFGTVQLEPPALVDCPLAVTAARFVDEVLKPEIENRFGAGLATLRQASGYVCRPRNGSSKLSEHARGRALDIAAFELSDGRTLPVEATSDRERRDFLRRVRGRACGPFKTVLGPGSDADHADHLHLDLAERRRNATYCQ